MPLVIDRVMVTCVVMSSEEVVDELANVTELLVAVMLQFAQK